MAGTRNLDNNLELVRPRVLQKNILLLQWTSTILKSLNPQIRVALTLLAKDSLWKSQISKCRDQLVMGCPTPVYRSPHNSCPKAQGESEERSWEDCQSQSTRKSDVRFQKWQGSYLQNTSTIWLPTHDQTMITPDLLTWKGETSQVVQLLDKELQATNYCFEGESVFPRHEPPNCLCK